MSRVHTFLTIVCACWVTLSYNPRIEAFVNHCGMHRLFQNQGSKPKGFETLSTDANWQSRTSERNQIAKSARNYTKLSKISKS
ncbi:unnamed protein product [Chondrus crispus]|uniref:Secreted protein n=1 Tax=Chondrus crispus TaxID=2769 RepID=R7QT91_CHOCR|nr:unnamed protein product [Chondrus crispus]CDF40933.1 unnamed protein product [Chondrus crispus]|eukprot:XP_005711227.1 unnamed protein product [Chondrus crispus]